MATSKITTASRPATLPSSPFSSALTAPATSPEVRQSRRLRWLFVSAVGLSLIALSVSAYLSYVAFTSSKILACGGGSVFDCDHVLHSKWSTMLGMPVAAWASSLYLSVLVALLASVRAAVSPQPSLMRTWAWSLVTAAGVSAGIAALWFTGLQVFVLKHLCPWCLTAHACGLTLCIATLGFSPLRAGIKRACTVAGSLGGAGLIAIQVMTPAPPTYTIEEFPATGSQVSGEAAIVAEPELFDAPGESGDVFDAPAVPEAPVLEAPVFDAPVADEPAIDDAALLMVPAR
ncbi:MAG: vitamin K epoxide reductase family protein, partial [Aureliella sp.]